MSHTPKTDREAISRRAALSRIVVAWGVATSAVAVAGTAAAVAVIDRWRSLPQSFDTGGGLMLLAPTLQLAFVGDTWKTNAAQVATITSLEALLESMVTGPILQPLTQYHDGQGRHFTNHVRIASPIMIGAKGPMDLNVDDMLVAAVASPKASRDPETLWLFITAPEIFTAMPPSPPGTVTFGHHGQFVYDGLRTFCVVRFPKEPDLRPVQGLVNQAYLMGKWLSHEIIEAITNTSNGFVQYSGQSPVTNRPKLGYRDWVTGDEICDLADNRDITGFLVPGKYGMTAYYNKADNNFVSSDGRKIVTWPLSPPVRELRRAAAGFRLT